MSGLVISSPSMDRFSMLLSAYLAVNPRHAGELVAKKAKDVSIQLYKVTAKNAPTNAKIAGDVKRLGWRVKRRKGKWSQPGDRPGDGQALKRMQQAQIKKRQAGRGFVASGWLPAVRKFGGQATGRTLKPVRRPRGTVTISNPNTGTVKIIVANQTPGILYMERKYKLTRTAFNAASADIAAYIRRKQQENLDRIRRG